MGNLANRYERSPAPAWTKPQLQHQTRPTGYVTQAMLDHFGSREAALRYLNEGGQMFRAGRAA